MDGRQEVTYRVLVTDEIDAEGVAILAVDPRLRVDEVPTLSKEELLRRIGDYDAIVGRSATRISGELLQHAPKLKVVGRAGVGVDNIALDVATSLGIAVINAPAGNTIAVVELFFGAVISLLRHIPRADSTMHAGKWDRSSLLGSELKGRTLGIVGLGRIGGEVATRARAFGMDVVAYDPYIAQSRFESLRAQQAPTLDSLLERSAIVTLHTPLTDETAGMIGRHELARLPARSIVVNMARGGIVDEAALLESLESSHLAGAVIDAYEKEPLGADHPLRQLPNVLLTPHIGASTTEAQRNVSVDVCVAVRDALVSGELSRSINVDDVGGEWTEIQPALTLARRAAAVGRAILATQGTRAVQRLDLRAGSALLSARSILLSSAARGLLEGTVEQERLNLINARAMAETRGIDLSTTETATQENPYAVEVRLSGGTQEIAIAGVAQPGGAPRLTKIGAFHVDVQPRDTLLILTNNDVPGVIGRVGTLLGEAGVNIAEYHQARLAQGGQALAAVSVDGDVSEAIRASLLELPEVLSAAVVCFHPG
ncbi:MAG TPA: phosphoglycerate dehydrogenase [Gemmatimonadaceae bacterium]|nr:phosphoglycerate dehydrogenase [Gemmatimonadaceae bacterium]